MKMSEERIQKVLAKAGAGSRREMERAIEEGRVLVNGLACKLGDKCELSDVLTLDGKKVKVEDNQIRRVLVYNKPEGEISTRKDPEGRQTIFDRLPQIPGERWVAVGRLDINTSGLLLFTNDGELANRLMHPSHQIEREYAVRVHGEVTQEHIDAMCNGVQLEDGMAKFTDVQYFDGSGSNNWFHVVVLEGRNREVRRLWESQGLQVARLKRVRYGSVFLESTVRAGTFEELPKKDIDRLAASVDLPKMAWKPIVQNKFDPLKRKMEKQRTRRSVENKGRRTKK
jgi:23S rRNA pseudouridine2605 synthase